jgi:hypothetical protein
MLQAVMAVVVMQNSDSRDGVGVDGSSFAVNRVEVDGGSFVGNPNVNHKLCFFNPRQLKKHRSPPPGV